MFLKISKITVPINKVTTSWCGGSRIRNEIANVFLIIVKAAIFVHVFLFLKFNWESFPYNKVIFVHVYFSMLLQS